ncbi:uncharacterized protein [Littorina saxatilis]|uniref:Macro domain-containing protein n=1 Tax=Littorina saxatilis TaxID=31220 RepID=A0AAN9GIK6_9CAEN
MALAPGQEPAGTSSTSTSISGIPVTRPQKELLNINSVMETFINTLEQRGVTVEQSTLHTDNITVTAGDAETGRQCLRSVIYTETLTLDGQQGMPSALQGLIDRFPSQMAYDVDASQNKVDVAFLEEISGEVLPVLQELKTPRQCVPLPDYLAGFLRGNLQNIRAYFSSQLSGGVDVGLDVHEDSQGRCFLRYRCEPDRDSAIRKVLTSMLPLFWFKQVTASRALGLFLTNSDAGKQRVKAIEDKRRCKINVEATTEHLLLTSRSPQGHRVMLCEGNMAASESDVIVLPLAEGQQEWPPVHRCILERALMDSSVGKYRPRVGLPPKKMTLSLVCQLPTGQNQRAIIMYIPAGDHDQFAQLVSQAVKEALNTARDARIGLCLPLKIRDDTSVEDTWRVLLQSIVDNCDTNYPLSMVKVYVDPGTECPDMKEFFGQNKWTFDAGEQDFMDRVNVVIGDIFDAKLIQADAVVNSTDPGLKHTQGQVSKLLLEKAGPSLTSQRKALFPGGIQNQVIAITDAFNLQQFKHVFHVVLEQLLWDASHEETLLEGLRSRVEACLRMASVLGLKSIAFPALATGNLRYPANKEAKTVLQTTKDFFAHMPHSSLQHVTFVCYDKNMDVAKIFKAEETAYRYARRSSPACVEECRYTVSKRQVQVIKGDPLSHLCTADLLIIADPPAKGTAEQYREGAKQGCSVHPVKPEGKLANKIRDIVQSSLHRSVQINLDTFDARHVDDVVSGAERGLSSARNVHILIIVVSSSQTLTQICNKSSRNRDSQPPAPAAIPFNASDRATVGICGELDGVTAAASEVKNTDVPEDYKEAETHNVHPVFLDQREESESASGGQTQGGTGRDGAATSARQQDEECATTIPPGVEFPQLMQLAEAMKAGQVSVNLKLSATGFNRITTNRGNLPLANRIIQETIARWPGATAPQATHPDQPVSSPQTGDGQTMDFTQSAGSDTIRAAIQSTKATSSWGFDKNVTPSGDQVDSTATQDPHPDNGFSLLDTPTDAGTDTTGDSSAASKQPGQTDDESFDVISGASADENSKASTPGTADVAGRSSHPFDTQSLRTEIVQLTSEQFSMLEQSYDSRAEEIEADVSLLPDEKKVVISAGDYRSLERATHKVKVKAGKVRPRSKERADERSARARLNLGTIAQSANPVPTNPPIQMTTYSMTQHPTSDDSTRTAMENPTASGQLHDAQGEVRDSHAGQPASRKD